MSGQLLAVMLAAWLLHELGHWLTLHSLGLGGAASLPRLARKLGGVGWAWR